MFVNFENGKYNGFNSFWLKKAKALKLDLFLLFFDDLIQHTRRALTNLAYFLGAELTDTDLDCVVSKMEGQFHRKKQTKDLFEGIVTNMTDIDPEQAIARRLMHQCIEKKKCGTSGCAFANF